MREGEVPKPWRFSKTILLHKKGSKEELANYRPITLLPVLYKVFTRCVLARIRRTLEEAQPVEQAGFRRGFSTMDHISTLVRVMEAFREHHLPLVLTFIDYQKAFDSVEADSVWMSLEEQGVEIDYIAVLRACYDGCKTTLQPFTRPVEVFVGKGVRQGDPISPNLFSSCLEHIIRQCDWDGRGITIDGRALSHLRFADDIVLITSTPRDASEMIASLDRESRRCGLQMNLSKTKVMRNRFADDSVVNVGATTLEDVSEYVYLGRLLNPSNELKPELCRRKRAGWAAYSSIKTAVEATRDPSLRAELFNSTVLPALCYAGETWTLTKALEKQLQVTQAAIERRVVGVNLFQQRERGLHNSDIRALSRVTDALQHVDKAKHRWAGHMARRRDNRWSTATLTWYPRDKKRPLGRPATRWSDSLASRNNIRDGNGRLVTHWSTRALDRATWRSCWDPHRSNRPC